MSVLFTTTLFIIAKDLPDDVNSHLKNTTNLKNPSIGADRINHTRVLQWNIYLLYLLFKKGEVRRTRSN